MEVTIDNELYQLADSYAQEQGKSLAAIIENFLLRLVGKRQATETVPDIVQSLIGSGVTVGEDDLNGREAYHHYLEDKHK